jgi:hypothetical protein
MTGTVLTVVEWIDRGGRGFARYRPPGSSGPPDEYWLVADGLLDAESVGAPPVRATAPHPVWSLQYVDDERIGANWCFAEQGTGGTFGPAGTCRMAFADVRHRPGDVWRAGVQQTIGPDGAATDPPTREAVAALLAALVLERRAVRVPGSPAQVASLFARVLSVLPAGVASRWTWSTCPLPVPATEASIVAADLPAAFRQEVSGVARSLDQIRWSRPPSRDELHRHLGDDSRLDAFDVLVGRADAEGEVGEFADSDATRLIDVLDWIAANYVALTVAQVPAALDSADGRVRLQDMPDLVRKWAAGDPAGAFARFRRLQEPVLRRVLAEGLVEAQRAAAHNLWVRPLTEDSADVIRTFTSDVGYRADLVTELLSRGVLSLDDLAAEPRWLHELKISPWDDPHLYPDRGRIIAHELKRSGEVTGRAARELRAAGEAGPATVLEVLERLGPIPPVTAARLVETLGGFGHVEFRGQLIAIESVTDRLMRAAPRNRSLAERWLGDLIRELPREADPVAVRAVLRTGLEKLPRARFALPGRAEFRSSRTSDPVLQHMCHKLGVDLAPDTVRKLPAPAEDVGPPQQPAGERSGTLYHAGSQTGADGWVRRNAERVVAVSVVTLALVAVAWVVLKSVDQTGQAGNPGPAPSVTQSSAGRSSAAAGGQTNLGSAEFPVTFDGTDAQSEFAVTQFLTGLRSHAGQYPVREVTLTGVAEDTDTGLVRAQRLRDMLRERELPDLAGALFKEPTARRPAGTERSGTVVVQVLYELR